MMETSFFMCVYTVGYVTTLLQQTMALTVSASPRSMNALYWIHVQVRTSESSPVKAPVTAPLAGNTRSCDLRVWKELCRFSALAAFPFFLFARELIKIIFDFDENTLRSLLLVGAARGAVTGAFTGEDSLL